jgi:hypothetical protein
MCGVWLAVWGSRRASYLCGEFEEVLVVDDKVLHAQVTNHL